MEKKTALSDLYLMNHSDQIDSIAACLADNFLKPLFDFSDEKNYFVYVGTLSEIMDWSYEFYSQYFHSLNDLEAIESGKDNVYDVTNLDDVLIAWGNKRIKQFYVQNKTHSGYSLAKMGQAINFIS